MIEAYTLEQAEAEIATLRGLVDRLAEAHTLGDSTDPPNLPAAGMIKFSSGGQMKYASADGNTYSTGRLHLLVNASQTISSTTPVVVGANSVPLTCQIAAPAYPVTYHVRGLITCVQGGTADAQNFRFAGPAVSASSRVGFRSYNRNNASGLGASDLTDIANSFFSTPGWANAAVFYVEFGGHYIFTAGGAFSLVAAESTNLHTFAIAIGSYMIVEPAT